MNPSTYLLILAFLLSAGPAIAADLWPEDEDGRLLVQEARLPADVAAEMAEQTGKTPKAIERIVARARHQFKRRWKHETPA